MPAAPIDVRGQVFSNLGPVIGGQLSDDPLQPGVGLLRTQGEVVISGLIQPARGTELLMGVRLPGGKLTRFPRRLRVLKADADPNKNQTTLTVGCLLAMAWDLVSPEIYYADDYPQWTPIAPTAAGSTPNICFLSSVLSVCFNRCGITQAIGNPSIDWARAVDRLDLSDGYLEIASRILGEAGFYGFIDAGEKLRLRKVLAPASKGPLLTVADTITMEAIGNPAPPEQITINYPAVAGATNYKPKLPDGDGTLRDWTYQKTISPLQTYEIEYQVTVGNTKQSFRDSIGFVSESITRSNYNTINYKDKDGKFQKQSVLTQTTSETTTCSGAINASEWKSKLEGGSYASPGALQVRFSKISKSYKITEEGPVEIQQVTDEYEPLIAFAGGLAIENYNGINIAQTNFLIRRTIVNKTEFNASDTTVQKTTVYQAWGATASGKTIAAATMKNVTRFPDSTRPSATVSLINRMSALVCSGTETVINVGRGQVPKLPTEIDQQNENLANKQNEFVANGSQIVTGPEKNQNTQSVILRFAPNEAKKTATYEMEYTPDNYLRPATGPGDNNTGMIFINGYGSAAAYEYGRVIYAIVAGMANGKTLTTELRNLPSEPMGTIYLEAAGTVGKFRANGITYAWDGQGLVAGCDAMLDGGAGLTAGASGADWFPMMIPAVNLSTVTPTTNANPVLANTITAPGGFDPMAPGNVFASFGTAGVDGDVYSADLTVTSTVGAVAEMVRRESVSRSLAWLIEASYNLAPVVETLISVAISYGTLSVFTVAQNPGVNWVTSTTLFIPGQRRDGQGYNGGIAWVTPSTTFTPGKPNNGPNPGVAWITPTTTFIPGSRMDGIGLNSGVKWVTPATIFLPLGKGVIFSLNMEGDDNSTVFTDGGPSSITVTAYGNARISTTNPATGNGCLVLDGIGDYLMTAANSNLALGTNDFSVKCKVYINGFQANDGLFTFGGTSSGLALAIYEGSWRLTTNGSGGTIMSSAITGVWQDIEVRRTGTNLQLIVNGNVAGTITGVNTDFTDNQLKIGYYYDSNYAINAKVDEFVITK